jgi:hypothetical protein
MPPLFVLWDESHLWGLLVVRALRAWGLPHRLVRGSGAAAGLLARERPAALLVPGGRAKGKAEALGAAGMAAVRAYVEDGGTYIGFCGGAGLGLSGGEGLGLCPWGRGGFASRLEHFLSGHVRLSLAQGHDLAPPDLDPVILAPVWWPAQFAPRGGDIEVLASYQGPGPDFWVADLSLASIPAEVQEDWQHLYGIRLEPADMAGRPAVIAGALGRGRYLLSYPHLETPASRQANAWLAHILGRILDRPAPSAALPAWDLAARPMRWEDPVLTRAAGLFEDVIRTGREHFLLFWRNPWLLGWRRGIPGSALDSLYALARECLASPETPAALDFWREKAADFNHLAALFHQACTGYLLAEHLAMTVLHSRPDPLYSRGLKGQREALFGPPPAGGGLYAELARTLEELYWRLAPGLS